MRGLLIIITLGLLAFSCKTKQVTVDVPPPDTYMDGKMVFQIADDLITALEIAEEKGKPLFVEFEADWCLPCKIMSEEVFTHQETADIFNDNFVNYKVDIETQSGANMKMLYGVNILPTLLILDHKGKSLARNDGSLMHKSLVNLANEAISNWEVANVAQ